MSSIIDDRTTATIPACPGKPAMARALTLALDPILYIGDEALLLICP